jgi:hypothetical protein
VTGAEVVEEEFVEVVLVVVDDVEVVLLVSVEVDVVEDVVLVVVEGAAIPWSRSWRRCWWWCAATVKWWCSC